jgi:uncharacterized membrane protein YgdD (TMEM256/DUF423 family)
MAMMLSSSGAEHRRVASIVNEMNARLALALAAALLFIAVGLGAFGAHALRSRLAPEAMAIFQTAVQYHFWHALGLLAVGVLLLHKPDSGALAASAWLLGAGIALFCGSLYLLALTGVRGLGAVTPVGGMAFLGAWAALGWAAWRW